MNKLTVGINGFGRFGLHLLKYWLDRTNDCNYKIQYINDDSISLETAVKIIKNDYAVKFNKYKINQDKDKLIILEPNGPVHEIYFSNLPKEKISWLGKPLIFLECSGKNASKKESSFFLKNETKVVLISATSWDADKTLVFGFNHKEFELNHKIISYGSCTVNAYVPLANYINEMYGLLDSDVNVIHNIQKYRLKENYTLNRKFCTLEKSAPQLLHFVNEENFSVNYTVIPYEGVSTIDYRFRLKNCPPKEKLINDLQESIFNGELSGLYGLDEIDIGPEIHSCTTHSAVFIKEGIKVINDQIYLFSYFDNENSVNRYSDLLNYIITKI